MWPVLLGSASLGAAVFLLVKDSLTDDAYITLAYAKNLALRGEWSLVPGMPANTATSPGNVLLLGGLTAVTRVSGGPHPVIALGVLTVALSTLLGWGWARLAIAMRFPLLVAGLGATLVLVNPFVLSAIGLEVLLVPVVLLWLVVFAVEGRPALYGVISGLAVLTRLDLVVFCVLIAVCAPEVRRGLGRAVGVAVLVAAPWYVFSWVAFGSAVPDTLVIKRTQDGLFGPWSYLTGPVMYYLGLPAAVLLSFGPALVGLVAWLVLVGRAVVVRVPGPRGHGAVAGLGAGGITYYVAYSVLGVQPYHWYFVPPIVALGMAGVVLLGTWWAKGNRHAGLKTAPLAALGVVVTLVAGGVAVDVRQGVPWASPVVFGNWASAQDYARVGRALAARVGGATVASPGEIGTLAYYCECAVVDPFSDRGRVVELLRRGTQRAGPLAAALLRVNYLWLDRTLTPRPVGYRLRYQSGPGSGPATWQVYSAAKGVGHFTLVPVGPGRDEP